MSDDSELTTEDLTKTPVKMPRLSKPIIIGLSAIVGIAILIFAGKFILSPKSDNGEDIAAFVAEESQLPEQIDAAGLAELLLDTLELSDAGVVAPNDTLDLQLQRLTGFTIDSVEYVELPGIDYLDDTGLLNAKISGDEVSYDTAMDFETSIASPMRPVIGHPNLQLWDKPGDTLRLVRIDTAAIIAAVKPQIAGALTAEIDSLAAITNEKERALQMLASDNQALTKKLTRYKPNIDSTRAAQIKRLVKIIETMSPGAAANMLSQHSPEEITEILFKVKPRKAAQILQQLPPTVATDIAIKVVRQ